MSSANSYPRCAIELRASRRLFLSSLLLFATVVAAPWLAGIPALYVSLIAVIALPAAARMFRWSRGEVRKIVWHANGRWALIDTQGVHEDANLLPGIWLGASFLSLRWRCAACGETFRATLLDDNCDAGEFRHLSVRIRLARDDELFPVIPLASGPTTGCRRS